ncbi:Fur family transcriptional regulator [Clostridium fallax]|uniref:Fe2+ or Zn2+ uptake regulation protein n=1 Tax=Clostridium fallax TaxID=1533 RepID=A0A1M4VTZ7_9CLOT|nr:Fur family transcriptional regulator [Clostridium fallax]SHE72303.1 Fe2+ or Zn2+ uptake regulation protein [Clostridium fallax]SQB07686.1 Fe2+/Zn2+ uptake regulation protein [Clostridium fallax]
MEIRDLLREKGIKITKGRIAIYNIIKNSDKSLTADNIYDKCKEIGENLNLSTIYRTLEIFDEKNITEKFNLGDGKYSFSIKQKDHKHILECSICHKEIEVPCPMRPVMEMLKNETGFVLTDHELVLKGICKKCKSKNKK